MIAANQEAKIAEGNDKQLSDAVLPMQCEGNDLKEPSETPTQLTLDKFLQKSIKKDKPEEYNHHKEIKRNAESVKARRTSLFINVQCVLAFIILSV